MFLQYVLNAHSVPIDIDRAVFLMDKKLWLKVCTKYHETGQTDPPANDLLDECFPFFGLRARAVSP